MRSITASSLCAKSTWTPWRTSAPIPIRSIASCCHSPPSRFSTLTLCRSVMVSIPPVRSWTTSDDNPFYGLTDVRITGVRVWLTFADGATYQGDVQIELTHSGPEQNRFAQRRALQLHARTHSQDVSLQHRHQEGDHRAVVWFVQAGGEIRIGWPLHIVA